MRSLQASFPSLTVAADGTLLAAFGLGSAFESVDAHTVIAGSRDAGRSWSAPDLLYRSDPVRPTSSNVRISRMPDGEIVAIGARWDRSTTDEGLVNPDTLGFVPTELIVLRSADDGRTWDGPRVIVPPLVGPSFEVCHPIVPLPDGRWLWPTSTWRGWDGTCPHGMKAVVFVSYDRGETWPEYLDIMDDPAEGIVYWEQKLVPFRGGLLAVCWAHDLAAGRDLPVQFALSADARTFTSPQPLHLHGQTTTPFPLDDERVLFVYRRGDQPGLWADVGRLEHGVWQRETELPLWGTTAVPTPSESTRSVAEEMSALRFGLPAIVELEELNGKRHVLIAFWCVEDCVAVIRWMRLAIPVALSS